MKRFSCVKVFVCFMLISSMWTVNVFASGKADSQKNTHKPDELVSDWNTALRYLQDGNNRYVANNGIARNTNEKDRGILKDGQKPFAVIVTCADSRVAPEIYFDQKLGDIFVIRNAGNIADATVLGSIEYAVEHLHAPLVVVVGHGKCGAVTGALSADADHHFPHNLQTILNTISSNITSGSELDEAILSNINGTVNRIKENDIVKETGAQVIGALYDIVSGKVTFYTP